MKSLTDLALRYRRVRKFSEQLIEPLALEDCVIQSMPDVSPQRWHLAHTTWFFETFVLVDNRSYRRFDADYEFIFNSYYNSVGEQFPRAQRGLLSRPTVAEVLEYRRYVDQYLLEQLEGSEAIGEDLRNTIEIGLHHEQQHQELMLTDIKHVLASNPLYPVYLKGEFSRRQVAPADELTEFNEGIQWIGHDNEDFCFDNELPRHRVFVEAFQLSNRLVTSGEYLEFVNDKGYQRPELWLSLGWNTVKENGWTAPLYWVQRDGVWHEFTLAGLRPLGLADPICHISFFEADAFARWRGGRLPTEAEWETASAAVSRDGCFAAELLERGRAIHPRQPTDASEGLVQMFGDVWQWTASPYIAYPGYRPPSGAIGEYNGKFMCNQMVLRGGSCATPGDHMRPTYRNFFPPDARWQFAGIRLAQ